MHYPYWTIKLKDSCICEGWISHLAFVDVWTRFWNPDFLSFQIFSSIFSQKSAFYKSSMKNWVFQRTELSIGKKLYLINPLVYFISRKLFFILHLLNDVAYCNCFVLHTILSFHVNFYMAAVVVPSVCVRWKK